MDKKMEPGFLPGLKAVGARVLFWFAALLWWEGLTQWTVFGEITAKFGYVALFSAGYALILAALLSLTGRKAEPWLTLLMCVAGVLLYGSQLVYNYVFGTLYSVALMEQGGAAVTSFWRETLETMVAHLPTMAALLLPLAGAALLWKKGMKPTKLLCALAALVLAAAALAGAVWTVKAGGTELFSDAYYYRGDTVATQQTARRFGVITAMRIELFGSGEAEEKAPEYYIPTETTPPAVQEDVPQEEGKPMEYNVLTIDFDALNASTEDETRLALNGYCQSLTGTNKNDYTGMLADYNLIVICGESFSTAAIHPEVTPNLYRLASEGILFKNYYNTFPNVTTDGEYALLQGLYPDSSREKTSSSLYASRRSYLPFAMGNAFAGVLGQPSYGYHNYKGDYYGRDESHPNMGYTMKFAGQGMKFTNAWPASDLEMMEQSVDDYITDDQFHAYYMTFSGHYRYAKSSNLMAAKNWDAVKDLPYSDTCKAYLSCNVELDKALGYLMQRLEEQGIADKTAIVLAGDHYPYGLTDAQYSELVGYEVDEFSKYKDTLIFWVGGLEENIVVEEYCCNVDILPTILNLWGIPYDSRMLAGTDVFSDGTHVAVLVDRSFITEKAAFSAVTGQVTWFAAEEGYVENMNRFVATKFSVSTDILQTAYYNFIFGKGDVLVDTRSWNAIE